MLGASLTVRCRLKIIAPDLTIRVESSPFVRGDNSSESSQVQNGFVVHLIELRHDSGFLRDCPTLSRDGQVDIRSSRFDD